MFDSQMLGSGPEETETVKADLQETRYAQLTVWLVEFGLREASLRTRGRWWG